MTPFLSKMGFRTLIIRNSDKLRLYLDNIIVETDDGEIRFLIGDLKSLIIDNYKLTLSVQLINKLAENNVSVVLCDLSHMPHTQLIPIKGNYAMPSIVAKQTKWSELIKTQLHQQIVKSKICSQISILKKNSKSNEVIEKLKQFSKEVQIADQTNREGLSAKIYFREMFGKDFIRFDSDIINAGLNYGYAVLRSLISSIIISKGLLLCLGIFHKGPSNGTNLADDVIEVYRPLVDDYVYNNLLNKELLLKEDKDNLIKIADKKILMNNQLFSINNTVEMYVESIIKCFELEDINYFNSPSLEKIENVI